MLVSLLSLTFLGCMVYVGVNIFLIRHQVIWKVMSWSWGHVHWWIRIYKVTQLNEISNNRLRVCALIHTVCTSVLLWYLGWAESHDLLLIPIALWSYVLVVGATNVSLFSQIPGLRAIASDKGVRLTSTAVLVVVGFVVHQYAGLIVGEIVGVSATNMSAGLAVARFLLWSAGLAFVLMVLAIGLEVLMFVAHFGRSNRFDWLLFSVTAFLVTLISVVICVMPFRFAEPLLANVVFQFDAVSAEHCVLSDAERSLSDGPDPSLKFLPLSTSQEKGLLVLRSPGRAAPTFFGAQRGRQRDVYEIHVVRRAECYQPSPITDADVLGLPPGDYR